jgi:transcriptional regulator with XRE-family HTH domain
MTINKKSKAVRILEKAAGREFTLSGLVESLRLCEELSQVEFAKKLKISPSHLCDIERGRKVISPERAAHFAKVLGMSPELFVSLSLQEIVNNLGLNLTVTVSAG